MITSKMFENTLLKQGMNYSQERQIDAAMIRNELFCGAPGYKRVYILDPDGWKWCDALFTRHSDYSLTTNETDRYLEFRPGERHKIGSYVFISDTDDPYDNIGFSEDNPINPFSDPNFNINKLWIIVGYNDGSTYPKYNVLRCNWDYKWICKVNGKSTILHSYGVIRTLNDYDSGIRTNNYTTILDQVSAGWIPDTHYIYGDRAKAFNLCDTRYLNYGIRLMVTTNAIYPKVYQISKIIETVPPGIIKYVFKQDEYNETRDNPSLMVCDYYDISGTEQTEPINSSTPSEEKTTTIYQCDVNSHGEMERTDSITALHLGKISYFEVSFSEPGIHPKWKIDCIDSLSDNEKAYYIKLLTINTLDEMTISIKPGKANSLIGKKFKLTVTSENGDYASSVKLEVEK
ncbi:hypothetical protein SAMN05216391_108114 [Lachnospiraceae bacterium KHCPX20]|nr:hypothetical protein SAMN05216391_108114 [Lachnospiraceae bacterium KHCPX20]